MKKINIVLTVIALTMFLVVIGYAGTATVTMVDSTTWTDGSALTTITGHNIYYGPTKGGPYPNKFPVGIGTNFSITSLPTGTNFIVATVLAKNLLGAVVESSPSNEALKVVDDRLPSPCSIAVN